MKIILLLLAVAALSAQETVAPGQFVPSRDLIWSTNSADTRLVIDNGPTYLTFQCGVQVNCKTGEVKIPEGMKVDEASRKFWIGLAECFPGVREVWVSGYLAGKK